MSVRVRFAPSPTGFLHVGGARTALYNYLFAKQHKGSFILRIEDTDQNRHQEQSISHLLKSLTWLGLNWDEGFSLDPKTDQGSHAPYRQSERLSIYQNFAKQLIDENKAYYCFMSPEQEATQKQQALKKNIAWKVSSPYRDMPKEEALKKIQNGDKASIRFKTPQTNTEYKMQDLVRGQICLPADSLGDFILIRTDAIPVYNFCCAIDDALMKISHVFRGEEHLINSFKQQLIQVAINCRPPQTGHLSIILDQDKKKLSKRQNASSIEHYQDEGYLPESLINFLSLLGWNPGTTQEFFYKKDLIQQFQIQELNKSSAVFDEDKLLWLNQEHIKSLSNDQFLNKLIAYAQAQKIKHKTLDLGIAGSILCYHANSHKESKSSKPDGNAQDIKKIQTYLPLVRIHFKTLKQAINLLNLLLQEQFVFQKDAQQVCQWPHSKLVLQSWLHFLKQSKNKNISLLDFKNFQKLMQSKSIKGKEFFMPLRCALIGQPQGIEIKVFLQILSVDQLVTRAQLALKQII